MIAWIATRAGVSSAATKVIVGLFSALAIVLAFIWYGAEREREGRAKADAEWSEANARMQAATVRATNAANAIAAQREAEQREQIEELRDAAKQATDEPVGPGTMAVIEQLRRQAGR